MHHHLCWCDPGLHRPWWGVREPFCLLRSSILENHYTRSLLWYIEYRYCWWWEHEKKSISRWRCWMAEMGVTIEVFRGGWRDIEDHHRHSRDGIEKRRAVEVNAAQKNRISSLPRLFFLIGASSTLSDIFIAIGYCIYGEHIARAPTFLSFVYIWANKLIAAALVIVRSSCIKSPHWLDDIFVIS